MKATQKDFAGIAPRAANDARLFFFCGPDEAGAHDAAMRIVSLLGDVGERIELAGADLRKDPVVLGDEARSTSLFGGRRHILVRAQGEEAHDAVANVLDSEVEICPILIVATGATDKSRTAKLLANRGDALVAMFYPPDLRAASAQVRAFGDAAGLRMDADVADRIARAAGMDSRLARSEIEKLALYLDAAQEAPKSLTHEALAEVGAATEEEGFAPLVNVVLSGRHARLPAELQRMRELGLNPVGLLLALERRAAQLAGLAAKLGRGSDIGTLVKAESGARRIFWKDQADIADQLRRWRGRRLERLVDRLTGTHRALLANSRDAEILLSQELAEIARVAASRG
ncbi:DNA polymerase III subunit delta [Novosphingobium marinum]|uniref:DNA-directed DNA polymerase n=1 Tax=Novosphingobium marinum TaxID=1514948 RepID=A0A7Y9XW82_9SPHN|nr:DNA polymerase III subunit delta [Novosphingobium marinum]NYH95744.1 DNA polymerase-3 subunit delta [Novosphingobium marinum]